MATRVLVPLAEGFEEIETVTIVDVLRRAELDVTLAGLSPGPVPGSRGIRVEPDADWSGGDPGGFDAIVLPGGMGGTLAMMESESLLAALRASAEEGRLTAAICAAPLVLAKAGVLAEERGPDPRAFTAHPSVHDRLPAGGLDRGRRVVRSGNLLTSQGPGTAMEFALALVEELVGPARARELAEAMVVGTGA